MSAEPADQSKHRTAKAKRFAAKRPRLPAGPDEAAAAWQAPGVHKDTPPPPVPKAVREDTRQNALDLNGGDK